MSSLFGNQDQSQPAAGAAGAPGGVLSFQGIPMDRRPTKLPLGRGLYEIVKVGTRQTETNFTQFYAVLKCLEHAGDAAHVGRVFEFTTMLQGMFVKNSLADIKQLLMFSFGKGVAALDEKVIGAVLDKECLADQWARFNATQSIEGRTVIGNKIRVFGSPGKVTKKDGTPKLDKRSGQPLKPEDAWPRYYFDPADAA